MFKDSIKANKIVEIISNNNLLDLDDSIIYLFLEIAFYSILCSTE